ncbi:MAG: NAD(P)H-dependent flavin oxidoreductase [Geminicoccaceae bacterium]
MVLPVQLEGRLRLPAVAAPMFLTSGSELVIAACRAGVLGAFPALNQRTTEGFEQWLLEIDAALSADDAPYAVNLIVHRTNPRVEADLERCIEHRVPVIITSLGAVPDLVEKVHGYGGIVFHDVISRRHAEKAIEAGVDGLILVSAGAGGHAGLMNPFAFVREVRSFFDGVVLLSGCISDGASILAAQAAGADLAYVGTRFIASEEARVSQDYKQMIAESRMADIVYTPNVSGIPANFLRASLVQAGLDPDAPPQPHSPNLAEELNHEAKAWKDIWSAGHGVGSVNDVPSVADLCARLEAEYRDALSSLPPR